MQDFPANSQAAKAKLEPKEKIEPITSARKADRRKRSLGRKFKELFIGGNGRDAFGYMVEEVVVPSIRDMLHEAFQSGLERLIYGDRAKPRRGGSGYPGLGSVDYTPYNRMSSPTRSKPSETRMLSRRARARHDFDEVIIPSRQEAEEVIDRLFDLLSRYGSASVADLYELTGIQSSHTDMKWGWTELRGAKAVRLRQGGFLLDLPEPEPLG